MKQGYLKVIAPAQAVSINSPNLFRKRFVEGVHYPISEADAAAIVKKSEKMFYKVEFVEGEPLPSDEMIVLDLWINGFTREEIVEKKGISLEELNAILVKPKCVAYVEELNPGKAESLKVEVGTPNPEPDIDSGDEGIDSDSTSEEVDASPETPIPDPKKDETTKKKFSISPEDAQRADLFLELGEDKKAVCEKLNISRQKLGGALGKPDVKLYLEYKQKK